MSKEPKRFTFVTMWIVRVISEIKSKLYKEHPEYFEEVDQSDFQSFMPLIFKHELINLLLSFNVRYFEPVFFKLYNTKFENVPDSKDLLEKALFAIQQAALLDKKFESIFLAASNVMEQLHPLDN